MSYEYWEKAMANPAALHAREFAVTTTPEPGYYRTYRLHEPVAIWHETMDGREDQVIVIVNGIEVAVEDHENVWLSCAKNPVSEEWYRIVEAGGIWPDLDEAVAGIGHNRRRDDPESLIDDLSKQAESYKEIADDEMSQRALSLRSAILEQHKRADTSREEAKKPHLTAARQVDEMWMPMVKKAKKWADYLRTMVEAYETKKRRLAREAEAEQTAYNVVEKINMPPEPKAQIRTGYGRAVSVSERPMVVGIENHGVLLDHLIGTQRELLNAYLMELAQKDVNAGITVPGVMIEMKAVLR